MKKIVYTIITGIALTLVFFTIHSCINDCRVNNCSTPSKHLTVKFAFADRNSDIQTRTETEPGNMDGDFNEQKITILDAFIYQGTCLKWKISSSQLMYDNVTNKVTIPIPEDKKTLFKDNVTITYDLYIVANNTADLSSIVEEENNLEILCNTVFQTPDFQIKGGSAPQTSFVMDGKISKIINLNNPDIGIVNLKRAASKIRLRLVHIEIPGYIQNGKPQARLVHFTDKSALMDGGIPPAISSNDWKTTSARTLSTDVPDILGGGKTTSAPFYAYSNDWKDDKQKATYLELLLPLKSIGNGATEHYRYRVPITPLALPGNEAQYINRLERNFLYDIAVDIKILGSIDEPPIEVPGNYIIKNWSTQEVLIDIKDAHYLVISERDIVMPNINAYALRFNSSIADVKLVPNSLKATYTYVDASTGQPITQDVAYSQRPTVNVQSDIASGIISINSPIPVNYIPKDIEFQITNGKLTETVKIRQLPATYFTMEKGERSNLRPDGQWKPNDPKEKNKYMYRITTLAPAGDIVWGFPPLDENGYTVNSFEVSRMVSPKFMMASQLGATPKKSYEEAVAECKNYWEETIKNGQTIRYDDWRLPTEAEIEYIDNLQHDYNNPQGLVMTGLYYWDAYRANGAYKMQSGSSGTQWSAHVRYIRDIKE